MTTLKDLLLQANKIQDNVRYAVSIKKGHKRLEHVEILPDGKVAIHPLSEWTNDFALFNEDTAIFLRGALSAQNIFEK